MRAPEEQQIKGQKGDCNYCAVSLYMELQDNSEVKGDMMSNSSGTINTEERLNVQLSG